MFRKYASLSIIVLMALFSLWAAPQMPEIVPIHWTINGEVDAYGSPSMALRWLPVATLLIWGVGQLDAQQMKTKYPRVSQTTFSNVFVIVMLVMATIHVAIIKLTLGWQFDFVSLIMLLVSGLLMLIAVAVNVDEPNPYMGFRFPWIMDRPNLWKQVQTLGNRAFFALGFITIVCVLLGQPIAAIAVLGVGIFLTVIVVGYTFYQHAKAGAI